MRVQNVILTGLLTVCLTACSAWIAKGSVISVDIATACDEEFKAINPATEFPADTTTFCYSVGLKLKERAPLRVVITARKTEEWEDQIVYDKHGVLSPDSQFYNFVLTREQGWPAGTYGVEVYYKDELAQSAEYTIVSKVQE